MRVTSCLRGVVLAAATATVVAGGPFALAAHAGTSATPAVTSLAPATGTQAGGTSVTITGSGFTGATAVHFGATAAPTQTVESDSEITTTSPAGSGVVDVTVSGPGGTSPESSADTFTYSSAPTVTSVSPSSGYTSGGTTVTITGTNFDVEKDAELEVDFGEDAPFATVLSATSTQLVVVTPESIAGVADVTVDTGDVTSATSPADEFTYLATTPLLAVQGKNASLYVSTDGKPFVSYGGVLKGAPSIVSSNDRNFYFVRGKNDDLYVRTDKTAFTHLRPHNPLVCATAPAAQAQGDGTFAVGCVGDNGLLYTATGTLPSTGNPVISSAVQRTSGSFDSDLTPVKGGVGSDGFGTFLVGGKAYRASGPESDDSDVGPYGAGNTYAFLVTPDGTTEPDGQGLTGQLGGTCAGAASLALVGLGDTSVSFDTTCRSTTSAATLVYESTITENAQDIDSVATRPVYVGGSAVGSPTASYDGSGDGVDILATGTNGRLYIASVEGTTSSGYQLVALSSVAVSGPAVSSGPPPAKTAAARRAFARRALAHRALAHRALAHWAFAQRR